MTSEEYRLEERVKGWNIFFSALFVALVAWGYVYFRESGFSMESVAAVDFLILSLAVFRLIRLFVYDNITLFIREAFLDVRRTRYADGGEEQIEQVPSRNALKRTLGMLFDCPWCMGVWMAAFSVFAYFAFPDTRVVFLILALAGAGSLIQAFAAMLGRVSNPGK